MEFPAVPWYGDGMSSTGEAATEVGTYYRRQSTRLSTFVPARIRLVGKGGEVFATGRAIVSDLSSGGVCLSRVRFHEGSLPLAPHQVEIEPSASDLAEFRFEARPVHVRYQPGSVAIGAEITRAPRGVERLFREPIPSAEPWLS